MSRAYGLCKFSLVGRAMALTGALLLFGQTTAANAAGSPAKTITGMWLADPADYQRHETLPLKPEVLAKEAEARKAASGPTQTLSDNSRKCLPIGMPGMMVNEFALEILQTPDRVTMISENSPLARNIYLKETAHPSDLEPSWNGHSI
ncbi:MAG TPA: hypothetical protein VG960_09635, partial [Caulobacteraceae bacterium]|nr:hypothetical protein [Caulobacteraceae bacterium]